MPKKFGVNTKAAEARARLEEQKQAKRQAEEKSREDAVWTDSDPEIAAKQARAKAKEERRLQELQRKQELRQLEEAEMKANAKIAKQYKPDPKVTRLRIQQTQEKAAAQVLPKGLSADAPAFEPPGGAFIEADINPNHIQRAEEAKYAAIGAELVTADDLDSALEALEVGNIEKHPEKRMARAWKDYVDERYPLMKAEFPSLKRSQLMERLHAEWQKAPENPMNKDSAAYNFKT